MPARSAPRRRSRQPRAAADPAAPHTPDSADRPAQLMTTSRRQPFQQRVVVHSTSPTCPPSLANLARELRRDLAGAAFGRVGGPYPSHLPDLPIGELHHAVNVENPRREPKEKSQERQPGPAAQPPIEHIAAPEPKDDGEHEREANRAELPDELEILARNRRHTASVLPALSSQPSQLSSLISQLSAIGHRAIGHRSSVYGHRSTVYGLRSTVYGLRSTVYGLRTTDYGLRTTDSGLRTPDYAPGTGD